MKVPQGVKPQFKLAEDRTRKGSKEKRPRAASQDQRVMSIIAGAPSEKLKDCVWSRERMVAMTREEASEQAEKLIEGYLKMMWPWGKDHP